MYTCSHSHARAHRHAQARTRTHSSLWLFVCDSVGDVMFSVASGTIMYHLFTKKSEKALLHIMHHINYLFIV